jgi:hypothetical protein
MGLDERYDEILQAEFSSEGALVADEDRVLGGAASLPGLSAPAREAPIHGKPEAQATPEAFEAEPVRSDRPRARARSRHAAMAGAGGMACAAMGALLGGLGGLGGPGGSGVLGVLGGLGANPAAAQPLESSPSPVKAGASGRVGVARGSAAIATASLHSVSGPLTQKIAPLNGQTAGTDTPPTAAEEGSTASPGNPGLSSIPGRPTQAPSEVGGGSNAAAGPLDSDIPVSSSALTEVEGAIAGPSSLKPITSLPVPSVSLPSKLTGPLESNLPAPSGIVSDVTAVLADPGPSSLKPITSLPVPAVSLPSKLLGPLESGVSDPSSAVTEAEGVIARPSSLKSITSLPVPAVNVPGSGQSASGSSSPLSSVVAGVVPSLDDGVSGSSVPALPSVPVPDSMSSTAAPPTAALPSGPTTGTTATVTIAATPPTAATGPATTTAPLPTLPTPKSTPPVSVGGVSVGVSTAGSTSGATLSLP